MCFHWAVNDLTDAVPAIFAQHAEMLPVRNRLDGTANIALRRTRLYLFGADKHGFVACLHQAPTKNMRQVCQSGL